MSATLFRRPQRIANAMHKSTTQTSVYQVGDEVEARYEGKGGWYRGKVDFVDSKGFFDIIFDDGERSIGLSPQLVRKPRPDSGTSGIRQSRGTLRDSYRGGMFIANLFHFTFLICLY